jgi:hypothetical protein
MEHEPRPHKRTKRGKRPYSAVLCGQQARSKRCFDPFSDRFASRVLGSLPRKMVGGLKDPGPALFVSYVLRADYIL